MASRKELASFFPASMPLAVISMLFRGKALHLSSGSLCNFFLPHPSDTSLILARDPSYAAGIANSIDIMPHKSIRLAMGKTPPDLRGGPWDTDKYRLERESCTVILNEQKLLICEASGSNDKASPTWPGRKSSSVTLLNLSSRRPSTAGRQQHFSDSGPQDEGTQYRVVGTIHPKDRYIKVFTDIPDALQPLKPELGDLPCLKAGRAAHNYLRGKPKKEEWKVSGIVPDLENTGRQQPYRGRGSTSGPLMIENICNIRQQPAFHAQDTQPRKYVLVERHYRCNCEKSYHPRHELKVKYKPGYNPPTEEEREELHTKHTTRKQFVAAGGGASGAAVE